MGPRTRSFNPTTTLHCLPPRTTTFFARQPSSLRRFSTTTKSSLLLPVHRPLAARALPPVDLLQRTRSSRCPSIMTPDAAHNPSTPPPTVILWVHPRSTSTMFECILVSLLQHFRSEVLNADRDFRRLLGRSSSTSRMSFEWFVILSCSHFLQQHSDVCSDTSVARAYGRCLVSALCSCPLPSFFRNLINVLSPIQGISAQVRPPIVSSPFFRTWTLMLSLRACLTALLG